MSWVEKVVCSRCGASEWHADGGWHCVCGKPMLVAEIEKSRQ